jgi:outer membrane protein insertion porin family
VGPKVRRSHAAPGDDWSKPVGGDSMAMANVEYTIPLVKPLRFAVFYDIGNVWAEPYEFDFDELASSVGLGIRFDIPGFPMRFDYAWVLEKDDDYTDEKRFSFTLGYGF